MFRLRFLSFIILLSIFFFSILWRGIGGWLIFSSIGVIAAIGAVYETLTMLEKLNLPSFKKSTAIAGGAMLLLIFCGIPSSFIMVLPALFIIALWISLLIYQNREKTLKKVINSAGAFFMVVAPLSFIALIYMDGEGGSYAGRSALLLLVLITKAGDTGAYVTGMLSNQILKGGNHPIVPGISPKKSREGTVGGLISSILVSFVMFNFMYDQISLWLSFIAGVLLFIGGFCGDLAESALKRTCKIKDSGTIIPGMGGFFDVLDSFIFNAPLFYLYLLIFIK